MIPEYDRVGDAFSSQVTAPIPFEGLDSTNPLAFTPSSSAISACRRSCCVPIGR
jgi:hypothetical protein